MNCIEYGREDREHIMLLHGGGLSWWNFREEARLLSKEYHVILPILDGHAGSTDDFGSIGDNAERLLALIDRKWGGSLLMLGGLSLGAQVAAEILCRRGDVCRFALLESVSLLPSRLTAALVPPMLAASYGLVRKRWFARLQAAYLRIDESLFEDYYRDSARITRENMMAFLQASTVYALKPEIKETRARLRILLGEKEQPGIHRSAALLQKALPQSRLEVKKGLHHGEYSLNHPEVYVRELLAWLDAAP